MKKILSINLIVLILICVINNIYAYSSTNNKTNKSNIRNKSKQQELKALINNNYRFIYQQNVKLSEYTINRDKFGTKNQERKLLTTVKTPDIHNVKVTFSIYDLTFNNNQDNLIKLYADDIVIGWFSTTPYITNKRKYDFNFSVDKLKEGEHKFYLDFAGGRNIITYPKQISVFKLEGFENNEESSSDSDDNENNSE